MFKYKSLAIVRGTFFFYCKLINCSTVKPVLSDHILQQGIFLAFQTAGCLLLHESRAESFLYYFQSAISNHLSIAISMSPEWMVA